jgi:hypothetical protein
VAYFKVRCQYLSADNEEGHETVSSDSQPPGMNLNSGPR